MIQTCRKVIVFDLDDTLYKEVDFLQSAYREIATFVEQHFHLQDVFAEMMRYRLEGENVFQRLISEHHLDLQVNDLLTLYRNHQPAISLAQLVRDTLEHLHHNHLIGLITDGRSVSQHAKIDALGLAAYMKPEDMLISEDTGFEKPSVVPFCMLMKRHPAHTYYYIGDNPAKDFVAPNSLGWITICLLDNGMNIHPQQFTEEELTLPRYRISDIGEIIDIIEH